MTCLDHRKGTFVGKHQNGSRSVFSFFLHFDVNVANLEFDQSRSEREEQGNKDPLPVFHDIFSFVSIDMNTLSIRGTSEALPLHSAPSGLDGNSTLGLDTDSGEKGIVDVF